MLLRIAVIVILLPVFAAGQVRFSAAWKGKFVVVPEVTRPDIWRLSPAEQRRADAFFAAVTAIFRQDPLLTRTAGYSVHIRRGFTEPSSWVRDLRPPYPGFNIQYWMQAAVSAHIRQQDGTITAWEDSTSSLQCNVNQPEALYRHFRMSYRGLQDRHDNEIFFQPQLLSGSGAVKRYEKDFVIIHRKPVPLWIPVTRAEYLQALIDMYDPARKGKQANALMADFFRKELAAQTPAARRSAALHDPGSESPSGLVASGGRPLVRVNPAFFDRKQPRSAVQLIVFRFWYYIPRETVATEAQTFAKGGSAWVMLQLQKSFAVRKLAALVE